MAIKAVDLPTTITVVIHGEESPVSRQILLAGMNSEEAIYKGCGVEVHLPLCSGVYDSHYPESKPLTDAQSAQLASDLEKFNQKT